MIDCDGCPSWDVCVNCTVLDDVREPACAVTLEYTTSPEATGTLETLVLASGYWRATQVSKVILSCFNEEACPEGGTAGGYCAAGYEGPCESVLAFALGPQHPRGSLLQLVFRVYKATFEVALPVFVHENPAIVTIRTAAVNLESRHASCMV